jgi:hypothetical protein
MGSCEQAKALIEHELNLVHRIGPGKRRFLHLSLLAEGKPIFPVPAHVGQ